MYQAFKNLFHKKKQEIGSAIKILNISEKTINSASIMLSENSLTQQNQIIFIQKEKEIEFIKSYEEIVSIVLEGNIPISPEPINKAFPIISIKGDLRVLEFDDEIEIQKDSIIRGTDFRVLKTDSFLETSIHGFNICKNKYNFLNEFFDQHSSEIRDLISSETINEIITENKNVRLSTTITKKRYKARPAYHHLELWIEDNDFDVFIKKENL